MAKVKLRDIIAKVPFLDRMRIQLMGDAVYYSLTMMDESFDILRVQPDSVLPYIQGKQQGIFAIYHGRMVGILRIMPRDKFQILISKSRDGQIISRGVEKMGFSVVNGSSGKGAVQATKHLLKATKKGYSAVVTVDGPRGPMFDVKVGIIRLAEMTGLPIIPSVCSTSDYTEMWGWDKYMATHFGSPIIYMHSEPIFVPRGLSDDEIEQYRLRLVADMERLRQQSDDYWKAIGEKRQIIYNS